MKSLDIKLMMLWASILVLSCNPQMYTSITDTNLTDRNNIKTQSIELAKDILSRYCKKDRNRIKYWDGSLSSSRKEYRNYGPDSMMIIPISLYTVFKEKENYGESIVNYLSWDKNELLGFYTAKKGNVQGVFDWSGIYNFNLSKDCSYLDRDDFLSQNNQFWLGYDYLERNKRSIEFLFGVKYFVNTLWFIEHDEVYVLDLKEMQIYDPDEFIKTKCYDGFIKDIANGDQVTCNY